MRLKILDVFNYEIVHYADKDLKIFSRFNRIIINHTGSKSEAVTLPIKAWEKIIGKIRLFRRLLRLDKMCVVPANAGYVIFWQGKVYHYVPGVGLTKTLEMESCRNPLHNSIANIDGKLLYFGEYGKKTDDGKYVYRSEDGGLTWHKIFHFQGDTIKHIHACKWDPYEEKIWVLTGDFEGESYLVCADRDFRQVEWIGDGSQFYRAIDLVFREELVHWCMDSPIRNSHHITLNRKTREIKLGQRFPGPVWYIKELTSGGVLAATAQEIGPSHIDDKLHIMYSKDLDTWEEVATYEHDGLKKGVFKFGVMGFSDGEQTEEGFFMHAEAVKHYDGKSLFCCITND